MMTVVSFVVFLGAFVAAASGIALSIAPQWRRIVLLATGHVGQRLVSPTAFAHAGRRIAVRRWEEARVPVSRMRAAA